MISKKKKILINFLICGHFSSYLRRPLYQLIYHFTSRTVKQLSKSYGSRDDVGSNPGRGTKNGIGLFGIMEYQNLNSFATYDVKNQRNQKLFEIIIA